MNRRNLIVSLCAVVACMAFGAASANAAPRIESFESDLSSYQAGGHPDASTTFRFATAPAPGVLGLPGAGCATGDGHCDVVEGGAPKDLVVELPKGLVGNPRSIPQCTVTQLTASQCPTASQIGFTVPKLLAFGSIETVSFLQEGVYNMTPDRGEVAKFGFRALAVNVLISVKVRNNGDYGITTSVDNVFDGWPVFGSDLTIWGVPYDKSHDPQRACYNTGNPPAFGCSVDASPAPFLAAPAECGTDGLSTLRVNTYQEPGNFAIQNSTPHQVTGCDRLTFQPSMKVSPGSSQADSPARLKVDLNFPQHFDSPAGLESPPLRTAKVILPEGMTINPSSAGGLGACSDEQMALGSDDPVSCPDAAKIGSIEAETPVLDEKLTGSVYLGTQLSNDPESGQMFRIFLDLINEERGIDVKLSGQVKVNSESGRIEVIFADNPQLPVSQISLSLKSGPRAPLAMPASCGTKTTTAVLTSWGGQTADLADSFNLPCPAGEGFSPKFEGGTTNPVAGRTSPFTLHLGREDNQQLLSGLSVKLPAGLSAYLRGVPYCADAMIAAASSNGGKAELASPSCSSASQIGSVNVGAGAGSSPYVVAGKVYLAGPYKGAPLSLAVITPAVAGPFDLGTVVVRVALQVNPETAQITAVSDPLPRTVKGVPLRLRTIDLDIDRDGFTLNPTSCDPMAITSTITSAQGATASPSSRFQVGSCEALPFRPRLKLQLKGATGRIGHPALKAVLTAGPGEANIGRAQVNLPHGEFLDQGNLNKTCTRPVLLAGDCPESSVYGRAKAWTPLLDEPLEGPVYLVGGYGYKLPALVADLDGQIKVLLVGKVDSGKNKGIRNTFELVPDAPVSRFVLEMKGGKKYGLLENSEDLCKAKKARRRAIARFTGQNGKVEQFKPVVANQCGKKAKKKDKGHGKKGGKGK